MKELLSIKTENNQITVLARDLHDFLESQERFSKWFERMVGYGLEEDIDFNPYQKVQVQNEGRRLVERQVQDYQLTIDAAKQISMLQRNDKGLQARKYFIEVEKAWNTPEKIMARALEFAKLEIASLETTVQEMKPKALFADSVSASHTSILIGDMAKLLRQNGVEIGQNRLFEELRQDGFLIKRRGESYNMPTQYSMELGLIEIKERTVVNSDGSTRITKTPKVTGKGQVYFINRYLAS